MAQRRLSLALFALLAAFQFTGARADVADFYGNWENAKDDASGIAHVAISPAGGSRVSVRVYGDCHPIECNWGLVEGQSYTADPRSGVVESILAVFNTGFSKKQIIFRQGPPGELLFEVLTDFSDGSGQHDFDMTGTLRHSAWAGPVSQNWERPAGLGTSWGGGARDGASPKPDETCVAFDGAAARTERAGASWKIMAGSRTLMDAGADERIALRALDTIRYYRLDRQCRVASNVYWKSGASFPSAKMGGADCIQFNPTTVHATHMGHSWKIVDGVQWIADFGAERSGADATLALIRFHHLDAECFVGRPNPVMTYWLGH